MPERGGGGSRARRASGAATAAATPAADPARGALAATVAGDGSIEVDLDPRSVAVVLAAFVGLVALTALVRAAPRSLAAIVIATLLALALSPLVARVEAVIGTERRPWAVGGVLTAIAGLFVVGILLLAPAAVREARDLPRDIPRVARELGELPWIGDDLVEADVPARMQQALEDLPRRLAGDTTPLERVGRSLADGVAAALATLLLATALLLDGPRLLRRAHRLVPPARRDHAARIASLAYETVGRYVAGSLLVALVAGTVVLAIGLTLGVPLAPLAAAWVAMWDLVPQVGGAVGGIPFVLLAFTAGPGVGLICAVAFVVYLQIENHVIGPLLVGQAVKLSPPATMTAALVGVSAAGVVGALVAVPLVGAAKAVYLEVRRP